MLEPCCGTQKSWYPRVGTNQAPAHKRTHTRKHSRKHTAHHNGAHGRRTGSIQQSSSRSRQDPTCRRNKLLRYLAERLRQCRRIRSTGSTPWTPTYQVREWGGKNAWSSNARSTRRRWWSMYDTRTFLSTARHFGQQSLREDLHYIMHGTMRYDNMCPWQRWSCSSTQVCRCAGKTATNPLQHTLELQQSRRPVFHSAMWTHNSKLLETHSATHWFLRDASCGNLLHPRNPPSQNFLW